MYPLELVISFQATFVGTVAIRIPPISGNVHNYHEF